MASYRFEGEIGPDHRIAVPVEIPAGPAEITLVFKNDEKQRQIRFQEAMRTICAGRFRTRSRESIEEEIRRERDSWE